MDITLEGLSLHVSNLEKSIEFYSRIPGAVLESQRPGQFARFRIGEGSIHLVQLGKVGFHMELNIEDVQGVHGQLTDAGLAPSRPTKHPWGKTDFRVVDPDGNALEFGYFDGSK